MQFIADTSTPLKLKILLNNTSTLGITKSQDGKACQNLNTCIVSLVLKGNRTAYLGIICMPCKRFHSRVISSLLCTGSFQLDEIILIKKKEHFPACSLHSQQLTLPLIVAFSELGQCNLRASAATKLFCASSFERHLLSFGSLSPSTSELTAAGG